MPAFAETKKRHVGRNLVYYQFGTRSYIVRKFGSAFVTGENVVAPESGAQEESRVVRLVSRACRTDVFMGVSQ